MRIPGARPWVVLLLGGLGPALLLPAAPPESSFQLTTLRDAIPQGPLRRLEESAGVQVGDEPAVPFAQMVSLRALRPLPHFPDSRPHARLTNGDCWPGSIVEIVNDRALLRVDFGLEQDIEVPLDSLRAVWCTEPAARRAATPAGRAAWTEPSRLDRLVLANGDILAGTLLEWSREGLIRLETAGRTVPVPRERVQAVLFNSELARAGRGRDPIRKLVLTQGARLRLREVNLIGDTLIGKTPQRQSVRVPRGCLAAVDIEQGPALYLSDLKPLRYEHHPFLGLAWPLGIDRCVSGLDLRLGGGTHDRGLGMHSRSRATYAVPAGAARFEAWVGLDEVSGARGSAAVQVVIDDAPAWPVPKTIRGAEIEAIRLPIHAGTRTLTLETDYGPGGDLQDHVDWADARLIIR